MISSSFEVYAPPKVSVLISTRNRPEELRRCIASVLKLDYPDFEVVVIDQSDLDQSARIQADFADDKLNYHWKPDVGLSRARNAAIHEASGDVFAFTDDDCTVSPAWLRRIVEVFSNEPQVGLIFGAFEAISHNPLEVLVPSFTPPRYRRLSGRLASLSSDSEAGGNMAARRRVFDVVGDFDPNLGAGAFFPSCDDNDLNDRALSAGFAVLHDPANAVLHWGARSYADGSARRLVLGDAFAFGALMAKESRCGDLVAILRLFRLVFDFARSLISSLLRGRRPTGTARLVWAVRGFWSGLNHPLDRGARVFLARQ